MYANRGKSSVLRILVKEFCQLAHHGLTCPLSARSHIRRQPVICGSSKPPIATGIVAPESGQLLSGSLAKTDISRLLSQ